MFTTRRRVLIGLTAAVGALALSACVPLKKAGPQVGTQSFGCTNGPQSWVVPAGVTSAVFELLGAEGGAGKTSGAATPTAPGRGARVEAALVVTPGESIQVNVGCEGRDGVLADGVNPPGGSGGFNGGGAGGNGFGGGGGGGGASDVRRGGTGAEDRILVAAGGGGSGGCQESVCPPGTGGAGAHPTGGDGNPGGPGAPGTGGTGGTQAEGGNGSGDGDEGDANAGGTGGGSAGGGGGGGGSGLFGGGGGGALDGGGGGSSFGPNGATFENGVRAGNGSIVIAWVS